MIDHTNTKILISDPVLLSHRLKSWNRVILVRKKLRHLKIYQLFSFLRPLILDHLRKTSVHGGKLLLDQIISISIFLFFLTYTVFLALREVTILVHL